MRRTNAHLTAPVHGFINRDTLVLILSPFEWTIAKRYMLPRRGEAVIALVSQEAAAYLAGVDERPARSLGMEQALANRFYRKSDR